MREFTTSREGETMDDIAYRMYGKSQGITERLLSLNWHLCQFEILPIGSRVFLLKSEEMPEAKIQEILQLWN